MSRTYLRAALSILIVGATVTAFILYFRQNPDILDKLRHISALTLIAVGLLYVVFMATLIAIQNATLQLSGIKIPRRENALLMMYSSIINFFGPLQSGPGFRAIYLKKKHNINLRKYTLATFLYYGLYAAFSALFFVIYIVGWWSIVIVAVGLACLWIVVIYDIPYFRKFKELHLRGLINMTLATFAQVSTLSFIYFVALHSVMPQATYMQVLAYTGAANFALFVSITPGAIGFRESFLYFTQGIHGIGTATIASASIIDRSVYILFLLVMAAVIFGFQAHKIFVTVKDAKAAE